MKKRTFKKSVAFIALLAMLTQNAFTAFAAVADPIPVVENDYEESSIIVETDDMADTEQEDIKEAEQPEIVIEPEAVIEASEDNDEALVQDTEEITDDSVLESTDDEPEVSDEPQDTEDADDTEDVETPSEEPSKSGVKILDSQISGSGVDSVDFIIDTDNLNAGDSFKVIIEAPESASYDVRLSDTLDSTAKGQYSITGLNGEGFNIRTSTDSNVKFEYDYENGIPCINVVSIDAIDGKVLYTKNINSESGKPVTAIIGEGFSSISIAVDTENISEEAQYTAYVDTEASVNINGTETTSFSGTKETESIELSNLDKNRFTVYISENEGFDITASATVNSVEDGDAVFYLAGEGERVKTVYTYSDDDVTVTATLEYANAVPDDAEFVVTPIKAAGLVNAYIDALNDSDDGLLYSKENTLLYDVAFLVDKVDEEGNVIPGEKVEFEPEVGSVTIDIKFINSQLTDELGASDSENITVNHLPLKDDVKDAVDKTIDATDIDASDIVVEPVNADVNVKEDGTDEVTLSVDSLSVLSVTNGKPIVPGAGATFEDVLGEAKNYGIVANQMTLAGHMETNFAVGSMHGNADIQGPKNEGKSAGTTYIGAYDGNNFKMTMNGNSGTLLIYTTYAAVNNFGFNMTGYNPGQFPASNARPSFPDNVVVNYNKYDSNTIKNMVSGMVNRVYTNSDALFGESKAVAFSDFKLNGANYPVIDIASVNKTPGTYYINFRPGEYTGQHFVINITADQNIVFNIPDTKVAFGQYEITIGDKNYGSTQGNANEDIICQKIIFNCPNATYAHTVGPCAGTFLCPKADFETDSVAAGWLVANNVKRVGGNEWHCVYHNLPDPVYNPTSLTLGVEKELKNILANEEEPFNFVLYQTDSMYYSDDKNHGTQKKPVKLDEITISSYDANHKGKVNFKPIEYKAEGTYYYVIREDMQGDQSMNWAANNGCYAHIEVVVKKDYDQSTRTTTYYVDSVRYSYGMTSSRALENPVNLNKNNAVIPFINEKHKTQTGLTIPVTKIMQDKAGTELPTWPIDETFNFKIEPMTQAQAGNENNVSDNPPMPSPLTISADNAHKTAEFVWPEGSFKYTEDLTPGISSYVRDTEEKAYGSLVDGATVYPRCYMYKVTEVIPNPKTEGVTYDDRIQYVKVWHNSCKLGSLRWVEISVNGSTNLNYCGGTLNKIEFVNKYEAPKGALKVTKSVKAGNIDYDTNESFYFIVKKGDEQIGDVREIKAKETVTVSDLALGTYTVIETDENGTPVSELESFRYKVSIDRQSVEVKAGQTSETVPLVTITNRIDIESEKINIGGIKSVNVNQYNIKDGEFGFTLEANPKTAPMPEKASQEEKNAGKMTVYNEGTSFNFGDINYTKDDIGNTYEYKVTESYTDKNGFAENLESYVVKVVVNQQGNKVVPVKTIKYGTDKDATRSGIKFTNNYSVSKEIGFYAKKTITGRNLSENEFTFVLEGTNENTTGKNPKMPQGYTTVNGKTVVTKHNTVGNADVDEIFFGNVTFNQNDLGKTFTYSITEQGLAANEEGNGVEYDTNVYSVTVIPKLDSNNNMILDTSVVKTDKSEGYIKDNGDVQVLFNNTYNADGETTLIFTKAVKGNMPENKEFTFELYRVGGNADGTDKKVAEKTISGTYPQTVSFSGADYSDLKFGTNDIGKNYEFYAKEVVPAAAKDNYLNGVTYDTAVHHCTVEVSNAGLGKLGFTVKYGNTVINAGSSIATFTNEYDVTSVDFAINGKKNLPGKTINAKDYSFTLAAVSAKDEGNNGIDSIPVPDDLTAYVDGNGDFAFGNITFTQPGTYTYTVTENEPIDAENHKKDGVTYDQSTYTVVIVVKDNKNGGLEVENGKATITKNGGSVEGIVFDNTYEAEGTVVLEADKKVTGRDVEEGKFYFGLYTADNSQAKYLVKGAHAVKTNGADGHVTFDAIKYSLDDMVDESGNPVTSKEFTYYIHELSTNAELKEYNSSLSMLPGYEYDEDFYQVVVTVNDEGTGVLKTSKEYKTTSGAVEIDNSYSAEGEAEINGLKVLRGREFTEDDVFIFKLYADDSNDANILKDASEDKLVDMVELTGSELVKNNGAFKFRTLKYTAEGTYGYTVKEIRPEEYDKNIIYDGESHHVEVIVSDNEGIGKLTCLPKPGTIGAPVTIINKVPETAGTSFAAYKISEGKALKAGEYKFTLKEIDTSKQPSDEGYAKKITTGNNIGATEGVPAIVDLGSISYEMKDAGDHVYLIEEDISGAKAITYTETGADGIPVTSTKYVKGGVTYDDTKFYAVVNVAVDNESNKVIVTGPVYYKNSIADSNKVEEASVRFTNKYAGKTTAQFSGKKYLYRDAEMDKKINISGHTFHFLLKKDGKVIQDVTNDGEEFKFSPIEYTSDEYLTDKYQVADNRYEVRYTIQEDVKNEFGVTYDTSVYDAVVTLSVDKNGNLKADKTVTLRGSASSTTDSFFEKAKALFTGNPDGIVFNNVYNAEGKVKLGVTKTLTGMEWGDATSFDFSIAEGSNFITQLINGKEYITVTKDSVNYTEYFDEISYDLASLGNSTSKTFTYVIKEKSDNKIDGVEYAENSYTVEVTVSDENHDGKLRITSKIGTNTYEAEEKDGIMVCEAAPVLFVNNYKPEPTDAEIIGVKVLTGKKLAEGAFRFTISPKTDGAPMPETLIASNDANGVFKFGPIAFTEKNVEGANGIYLTEKVFEYDIAEIIPEDANDVPGTNGKYKEKDGITYDAESKIVSIKITNAAGKLSAEVTPNKGVVKVDNKDKVYNCQFTNEFNKEDSTSLSAKKIVAGTNAKDKEFTFILKSLSDNDPNRAGKTAGEDGKVVLDTKVAKNGDTVTFNDLTYSIKNVLENSKADKTVVYTYEVVEDQTPVSGYTMSKQLYTATVTVKANDDGTLSISKSVVETKNVKGEDTGKTEPGSNVAEFTNTYDADGFTSVPVEKVLEGRDLRDEEFTFYLKNEAGTVLKTETSKKSAMTKNEAKNDFVFGGKGTDVFEYTMNALLNDDGSYAENTTLYYTIEEDIPTDAEKVVINGKTRAKKNSVIYDDGIYVVAVFISNPGNGQLKVDRVIKRFETSRSEAINSMKGFVETKLKETNADTFDKQVEALLKDETFKNVTKAGFKNKYEAVGKWAPEGKKVLTGRTLNAKEFRFTLTEVDANGKTVGKNVAEAFNGGNDKNELIVFNEGSLNFLNYTLADVGTHYYEIKEDAEYNKKGGVSYDPTVFKYTVEVSDNGDGTLNVTSNPADASFTFKNSYGATGYIDLTGLKTITGRDITDQDKFEFVLTEVTGDKRGVEHKVSNVYDAEKKESKIEFNHATIDCLNYEIKDGDTSDVTDHYYEIREIEKNANGITCDTRVYTVKVSVTDNGDGTLKAVVPKGGVTYPITGGGINTFDSSASLQFAFENKYEASADLSFKGVKHLRNTKTGADLKLEGVFEFKLEQFESEAARSVKDATGKEVVKPVECDGNGNYAISGIHYTNKDLDNKDSVTFYYRIKEVKTAGGAWITVDGQSVWMRNGIEYDNTEYDINVTVSHTTPKSDKLNVKVVDAKTNKEISTTAVSPYVCGGEGYFDFVNILPKKEISGTKTWVDKLADNVKRPDVEIKLFKTVKSTRTLVSTYTIKHPETTYTFSDLPYYEDGEEIKYEVEETPVKGYTSKQNGFDFTNTADDIELVINKISAETGEPLEGAVLAILDASGKEVERWTSEKKAHVVDVDKIQVGVKYTLHEVSAPTGYMVDEEQTFTYAIGEKTKELTMKDPMIKGNVRLRKLDAETRAALAGAEFALYADDGTRIYAAAGSAGSYRYSKVSSNGRFVVNASGELEVRDLPYGSYYFVETSAPEGYVLSTDRATFSVLADGETAEVSVLNTKARGAARLRKVNADGSRSLAGAVFELYAKTPSSASSAIASTIYRDAYYRVGSYTTDASGAINVDNLPWDDYYFIEIQAPDGYKLNRDTNGDPIVYAFTIGSGSTTTVSYDLGTITNETASEEQGEVLGERVDNGRRNGGVLAGVLGVRARPKAGVLGERVGPVTGDTANIILWLLLLVSCIGAIIGVGIAGKKKNRKAAK